MQEAPVSTRVPLPRWVTPLLALTAIGLVPWTLYLTFTLPSRQVTEHYDVAWVVFDIALLTVIATTAYLAVRGSEWLVPFAAVTGTMLVCDAWFDVVTSIGGNDWVEAVLEAIFAELPLAAVCALIVYDAERFRQATVVRLGRRRRLP
jgi:hypothetical protein